MSEDIIILAIESSCDETAASVIVNGEIKSNIVASQIDIHELYGGVVPEIASRNHLIKISDVVDQAIEESGVKMDQLSAVAVTYGPGLVGALLVGVSYAKALAYALNIKLIGVNHMMGHISACYIAGAKPPFLSLVVSGGHTMLVYVKDYTEFEVMGSTVDDAAGEAFDKVARVIGFGYPGGPKLDKAAENGNKDAIAFPRAMLKDENFNFSFSGLKSAALNYINSCNMKGKELNREDISASFRACVCDILTEKTIRAAKLLNVERISVCGGVANNSLLRSKLSAECKKNGFEFILPDHEYCSDNGAMIAEAAYYLYEKGEYSNLFLNAEPSLQL